MDYRLTATLLDSLGIALCVFDAQNRTVLWNQHFLRFFPEHDGHVHAGESYADNLRRFYGERLQPEDLPHIDRYISDGVMRHQSQSRPFVFQHRGRWLRAAVTPMANGDRVRLWTDLSDAGPQQQHEPGATPQAASLQAPDALRMLEHAGDGIAVQDAEGRIVFANDRFAALYGLPARASALERRYADLVRQCWDGAEDAAERAARAEDITAALRDSLQFTGVPFLMPLPGQRWVRVTMNRTSGGQTCAFHTDISADKREERALRALTDRLRQETHRDALTGLQNRRGLDALVRELSAQPGPHALLFIDLDGFKAVNDSAGHATGDAVLRQVATLLSQSVRASDTVVRFGGDEFTVLLRACGLRQARTVGEKIVKAVSTAAFTTSAGVFHVGASVGVRIFSDHADSPDVVLHDADAACYRAKRNGRGRVEVFGTGA